MQRSDLAPRLLDARVVLTCGVSGSGKTMLARLLEEEGYVRLSPDEIIWELYGDDFASMPFEKQKPVFAEMNAVVESLLSDMLDEGKRVVVDSTMCRRAKRDRAREICRSHGVEPVVAWLDAPYAVLRNRLDARKGTGPNDQIVGDDLLIEFIANFEPPEPDENCLEFRV